MEKQDMKQQKKHEVLPLPGIRRKAQNGHPPASSMISGEAGKVYRSAPHTANNLASDNLLNDWDMTAADAQDFGRKW